MMIGKKIIGEYALVLMLLIPVITGYYIPGGDATAADSLSFVMAVVSIAALVTDFVELHIAHTMKRDLLYSRGHIESSLNPLVTISKDGKITCNLKQEDVYGQY